MAVEFNKTTDPTGLEVYDSLEQRRIQIQTSQPITLKPADSDQFHFPVDISYSVSTKSIKFDQFYSIDIHNKDGRSTKSVGASERIELSNQTQFIGLGGPINIYCRISDPSVIETGIDSIRINFNQKSTIIIGARSLHERPLGTIQTTDDPESMMQAVSTFSSALKTTSPERSWPTLRGHPPLVERGNELDIPPSIKHHDSDITIFIPPEYKHIYSSAPLAFYLGANVRPGEIARLETAVSSYELGIDQPFEDDIARILKHIFLLDCVVRTEGIYPYHITERKSLEDRIPFELEEAYKMSLSERLKQYLKVPYDTVEPYIPRWPLTAHIPANPSGVEVLPFIINELGVIRRSEGTIVENDMCVPYDEESPVVRSVNAYRNSIESSGDTAQLIQPNVVGESIEHAWFGPNIPRNASKASIEAYKNQLKRSSRSNSIDILLICNDARMIEEHDLLDGAYGSRDKLPFDIDSEFGISRDRLSELLSDGGYDFMHFIGHSTFDGLECSDGYLDVQTLESVDLGVFFLNACRSYEQGIALIEKGAFAGVSTLKDVVNTDAVKIGEAMAHLLNFGFPLRAALELTQETLSTGNQYLIIGDGSADIAQSDGGAPMIIDLEKYEDKRESFKYNVRTYPTKEFKLGTVSWSHFKSTNDHHICPGKSRASLVTKQSLESYLMWIETPILLDNILYWNEGMYSDVEELL